MVPTRWGCRVDLDCFVASPISKQLVDELEYLLRIDVACDADNGFLRCEVLAIKLLHIINRNLLQCFESAVCRATVGVRVLADAELFHQFLTEVVLHC